jgi:hypothetical protein
MRGSSGWGPDLQRWTCLIPLGETEAGYSGRNSGTNAMPTDRTGRSASMAGSSSCRTRLRRYFASRLLASSRKGDPLFERQRHDKFALTPIGGPNKRPLRGGSPALYANRGAGSAGGFQCVISVMCRGDGLDALCAAMERSASPLGDRARPSGASAISVAALASDLTRQACPGRALFLNKTSASHFTGAMIDMARFHGIPQLFRCYKGPCYRHRRSRPPAPSGLPPASLAPDAALNFRPHRSGH